MHIFKCKLFIFSHLTFNLESPSNFHFLVSHSHFLNVLYLFIFLKNLIFRLLLERTRKSSPLFSLTFKRSSADYAQDDGVARLKHTCDKCSWLCFYHDGARRVWLQNSCKKLKKIQPCYNHSGLYHPCVEEVWNHLPFGKAIEGSLHVT